MKRESKVWPVIRVASGNMLEMYDFMVFGYYATAIGKAFFPSGSEFASLMKSLMTFGAGYLMRPLGAIVLGAYIDHHGRRKGLLLTLSLMAVGTLSIALTPGYEVLGLLAPMLVLLGRLVQGLSAGVELGGVSVYLAEIATPGRRGFYSCFQSGSQQVAVMLAALVGIALAGRVSPEDMGRWGWRIPLLVGCAILPLLFLMRRSLEETEEFAARKTRPTPRQIVTTLAAHWQVVVLGMMLSTLTTVCFYLITAYTPTFGGTALHLENSSVQWVILCVGASNFFWLPVMGTISDRVGRRPMLYLGATLALVTAYPVLLWLTSAPSIGRLLAAELWLSLLLATYNGSMVPYLVEIMPEEVRTSGFSMAFSLAAGIFGGFTPAVCTYLIEKTGNRAVPGLWLCFAAILGLAATALLKPAAARARVPEAEDKELLYGRTKL